MGTITYNADRIDLNYIYRATNGGTVFSTNLAGLTAFDYWLDTAQVGDCIYFGSSGTQAFSNLYLTVGTPANANWTLVWEYWKGSPAPAGWRTMHDLTDGTSGFTATGTVKFPLQANSLYCIVNGLPNTYMWVRCRIASLTSITEGGANATAKVQRSNGQLRIDSGYTEASPCTWTELYNWVVANAPEIGAYKWGNSAFKFDNCSIVINSPTRSRNEMVFFGNGCYYQVYYFIYLTSGDKVGTNGWSNPSYYFISTNGPTGITGFNNAKIYGGACTTQQFVNVVDGLTCPNSGYVSVGAGEHIGVYYPRSGYFTSGSVDRCIFEGSIITSSKPAVYPTNMQISNATDRIWSIYGNELRASDVTYSLPTNYMIYSALQYHPVSSNYNIDIINPNPALPAQTSSIKLIGRYIGSNSNPNNVLFYDSSSGTYTDYTAPAINSTTNDVPLDGDVGDIYYFKVGTTLSAGTYQVGINFTITDQSNNYEYVWEHSTSEVGYWKTLPSECVFDNTNNLTTSGKIYFATGNTGNNGVSVNGISGSWMRLRIIKKGNSTPKFTRVYFNQQLGIWLTSINEKYTSQFTIQDENGNPMQGANVTLTDASGTVIQFTTDANGKTTPTDLTVNVTKFDKNAPESDYNYSTVTKNPFKIKVKKSGYETYNESLNIATKLDKTVTLKKDIPNMIDTDGNLYPKLNVANDGAFRDMVIDGEIIL